MQINYDKLAIGLLETFDEEDKAAMAFGMIPNEKFQWFMGMVWEEVAKKCTAPGEQYGWLTVEECMKGLSKEFKREVEHEMSLALYRNAKMVV